MPRELFRKPIKKLFRHLLAQINLPMTARVHSRNSCLNFSPNSSRDCFRDYHVLFQNISEDSFKGSNPRIVPSRISFLSEIRPDILLGTVLNISPCTLLSEFSRGTCTDYCSRTSFRDYPKIPLNISAGSSFIGRFLKTS